MKTKVKKGKKGKGKKVTNDEEEENQEPLQTSVFRFQLFDSNVCTVC